MCVSNMVMGLDAESCMLLERVGCPASSVSRTIETLGKGKRTGREKLYMCVCFSVEASFVLQKQTPGQLYTHLSILEI